MFKILHTRKDIKTVLKTVSGTLRFFERYRKSQILKASVSYDLSKFKSLTWKTEQNNLLPYITYDFKSVWSY